MKGRTELGEIGRSNGVGVVFIVVVDGEEDGVELLQLHHILVADAVEGYHCRHCPRRLPIASKL